MQYATPTDTAKRIQELSLETLRTVVSVQAEMVRSSLDLTALCQKLAQSVLSILPAAGGTAIEILDGEDLHYLAAAGFLREHTGLRLPMAGSLSGLSLGCKEVLASNDVMADSRVDTKACARLGIGSMVVAPIVADGRGIGVLKVASARVDAFSEADNTLLAVLSASLGSAIANSREFTEQTRKLEAKFESIANSIPLLAWMTDHTGFITWYNQNWYDYTGTDLATMLGWGWKAVHREDFVERVEKNWREHLASGQPWEDTFPLRSKDGEWRWFLSRAVPVRSPQGDILYWLGTNTDITEQRRNAEALERALETRDEFLAVISHELRTPLTSMKIRTQMHERALAKNGDPTVPAAQLANLLQQMNGGLDRLIHLVEDMLDINQIQGGRLSFEFETMDMNLVVAEQLENLRSDLKSAGVVLTLHKSPEPLPVLLDKFRFEQVLLNLTLNVIRYASSAPLSVSLRDLGTQASLRFCDQGRGIPEADRERVFDRFERLVSSKKISGLGLGLYISREIVRKHGGTIRAHAGEEGGACFEILLPKAAPTPA